MFCNQSFGRAFECVFERLPKRIAAFFSAWCVAGWVIFGAHTAHAQQTVANGNYTIANACSGRALGLQNGKPTPWDKAVLRDAATTIATTWQVSSASDGSYILRAAGTDSALQTSNELTASGTNVDLWTYWGGASQRWLISDGGNGTYKLNFAAASAMALDAKYGSAGSETEVWLYGDNGTCGQRWQFSKVKDEGKGRR